MTMRYFRGTFGGGFIVFAGSHSITETKFLEPNECEWIVPGTYDVAAA